jgi:hypothetical protein
VTLRLASTASLRKGNAPSRLRARHLALVGAFLLTGCSVEHALVALGFDYDYVSGRSCRELADLPLAGRRLDLLNGRLLLHPPRGAHEERPDWPPPGVGDVALSRDAGEAEVDIRFDGMLIRVSELFRFTGPSLEDDAVVYASQLKTPARARPLLAHGARGVEVAAEGVLPQPAADEHVEAEVRRDFIASALFAHPDGTVLKVQVDADPRVVAGDLTSCVALATRIFETVEAGPRRLVLSAGERREPGFQKGEELVFDIPAGFAVSAGRGSLGVHKIVPFGRLQPSSLGLTFGSGAEVDEYLPGGPLPSYGESLEWSGPCEVKPKGGGGEGIFIKAPPHNPRDMRQLNASAYLLAPDVSSCEEMKRIARSLRVEARGAPGR